MPFGEIRQEIGTISQTDFSFTGQRSISMLSIMDYNARFYDPDIGRFLQPDSIVPNSANPQSWNRYTYANNNPSRYIDPTGHTPRECRTGELDPSNPRCKVKGSSSLSIRKPPIVSRSRWGAHAPGSYGLQTGSEDEIEGHYPEYLSGYQLYSVAYPGMSLAERLDTIVIHHEGPSSVTDYGYHGASAVLRLQEIAMEEGKYDIEYHFIIGPDGTIYEGRDIGARGTNVSWIAGNTGKIGILWLGAFTEDRSGPTDAQVASTVNLVVYLDKRYGIDALYGHGELEMIKAPNDSTYHTICPGILALPYVEQLKRLISP